MTKLSFNYLYNELIKYATPGILSISIVTIADQSCPRPSAYNNYV